MLDGIVSCLACFTLGVFAESWLRDRHAKKLGSGVALQLGMDLIAAVSDVCTTVKFVGEGVEVSRCCRVPWAGHRDLYLLVTTKDPEDA
jgi:hypothetical protein